ncbi:MAG: hypothetical protein ACYS8W_16100, partial [Planctomycetota bacterium]
MRNVNWTVIRGLLVFSLIFMVAVITDGCGSSGGSSSNNPAAAATGSGTGSGTGSITGTGTGAGGSTIPSGGSGGQTGTFSTSIPVGGESIITIVTAPDTTAPVALKVWLHGDNATPGDYSSYMDGI